MFSFLKKDTLKAKNTLLKWILQNISENKVRKLDVSKNTKLYYGRFLWNGLHEKKCYINKYRWDVQDLGKSANQSLLVER